MWDFAVLELTQIKMFPCSKITRAWVTLTEACWKIGRTKCNYNMASFYSSDLYVLWFSLSFRQDLPALNIFHKKKKNNK